MPSLTLWDLDRIFLHHREHCQEPRTFEKKYNEWVWGQFEETKEQKRERKRRDRENELIRLMVEEIIETSKKKWNVRCRLSHRQGDEFWWNGGWDNVVMAYEEDR